MSIKNMLKLERRTGRLGEEVISYEVKYPQLPWINLMATTKTIEPYVPLAPTTSNHPLSSAIGITYFSIGAVVMANLLRDENDRVSIASTLGHVNIRNLPFKNEGRQSPRNLVYFLLFERYVMDIPFRRVIKQAAKLNIHFDAYSHENENKPTTLYYTNWYPELVNRIVDIEQTGNLKHFLSRTNPENEWYKDMIFCDKDTFIDGYNTLISKFHTMDELPLVGRFVYPDYSQASMHC